MEYHIRSLWCMYYFCSIVIFYFFIIWLCFYQWLQELLHLLNEIHKDRKYILSWSRCYVSIFPIREKKMPKVTCSIQKCFQYVRLNIKLTVCPYFVPYRGHKIFEGWTGKYCSLFTSFLPNKCICSINPYP